MLEMSIGLRRYWVVLLSMGAGCSSEPRDCTNIGCELPQMRFGTTSDVAPGDYEFRFVLDGVALTCHAVQGETDVLFDCRDGLPLRLTGTFRSGELSGFVAELFSTPQEVSV